MVSIDTAEYLVSRHNLIELPGLMSNFGQMVRVIKFSLLHRSILIRDPQVQRFNGESVKPTPRSVCVCVCDLILISKLTVSGDKRRMRIGGCG